MHAPRLLTVFACAAAAAAAAPAQDGFRPLFNGTDLTGWVNVNGADDTWTVQDGVLVCSGHPTGMLRSDRPYENFVLELDWRHMQPGGNSGLFLWSDPLPARGQPFPRAIEVQILDGTETENYTSHGDVFSIHGAHLTPDRPHPAGWERCLPSEKRAKPSPEWNHYRVRCVDGTLKLEVNGKEVSGGHDISPCRGYICLESEGSPVQFRNVRIQELPAARQVPPSADPDLGWRGLFNGHDLSNWKMQDGFDQHWTVQDWRIAYDGQASDLWSWEEFGDFQLVADWRWTAPPHDADLPVILPSGEQALDEAGQPKTAHVPESGDSGIYLRGSSKSQVNIWCWPVGSGEVYGYRTDGAMPPEVRAGVTPRVNADAPLGEWNRFLITMAGDRLSVVLNGQTVLENAQLPGVAPRGPIALQNHGAPIEFANLYLRPLDGVRDGIPLHAATLPVPNPYEWGPGRASELQQRARAQSDAKLVFLGDSITEGWEWNGKEVWEQKFAPLGAVELGVGGDETEHVLWRLLQGDLDPLHPKLVVLMIGTNNTGNAHHTPRQVFEGVAAVVAELQRRFADTKVLLLSIFPRGEKPDDAGRRNNAAANEMLEQLADGARVFYLDLGASFLGPDATISTDIMPDFLHLTPKGYGLWAAAIEARVRELMH